MDIKLEFELCGMFSDPRFTQHGPRKYYAEIDGKKIGVVLATKNPNYDTFALNKAEHGDLLNAKRNGKIDEAFVVAVRTNGSAVPTYFGHIAAEELERQLEGFITRSGRFGDFYALQDYVFGVAPF